MRCKQKAFTLLELIIVIIVVGILAALGLNQYTRVSEKGKTPEAKAILGAARVSELTYYLEKGAYATSYSDLGVTVPTSCTSTHYFYYHMAMDSGNERVRATRCTAGGKSPNSSVAYSLVIRLNGTRYSYCQDTGCAVDSDIWW
jgi:prepilin-type N-terminal cleavage/methylation domain-containing protein